MENDLISRSVLNMHLADIQLTNRGWKDDYCETLDEIMEIVDEQPTVDAVEVVRCKDCRHYVVDEEYEECGCECCYGSTQPEPFDFCRYGERRIDHEH